MVMLDLAAEGNYVAVRPSGTEPIIKFYTFAFQAPAEIRDVDASRAYLAARLEAVEKDLEDDRRGRVEWRDIHHGGTENTEVEGSRADNVRAAWRCSRKRSLAERSTPFSSHFSVTSVPPW